MHSKRLFAALSGSMQALQISFRVLTKDPDVVISSIAVSSQHHAPTWSCQGHMQALQISFCVLTKDPDMVISSVAVSSQHHAPPRNCHPP